MKITIEPTGADREEFPKVALEVPDDDLSIEDALDLVKRGLIGFGYVIPGELIDGPTDE